MKIEFKNTIEDIQHFSEYDSKNSPFKKRRTNISRYGYPILFFIVLIPAIIKQALFNITLWFIVSAIWFLILPKLNLLSTKRQIMKQYKGGKNKILLSSRSLELSEQGIWVVTEHSESFIKWDALEKIGKDKKYIFIYVDPQSALIVPRDSFRDENEANEFLSLLESSYKNINKTATL
jgi:hypothetical protein